MEATSESEQPLCGPTKSKPIVLQVGERRFTTHLSTLTTESPYFARLLSAEWREAQADGSYFIDADGDVFADILHYLRSGVYPIFYSSDTGHDYGKYHALLGEAEYFAIEGLRDWLKYKMYEDAIKITHSVSEFEGFNQMSTTTKSNVRLEYHPTRVTEKVYVCPRGIFVHNGNRFACGRQCDRARGDAEDEYKEEEVVKTIVVSRETIMDTDRGFRV